MIHQDAWYTECKLLKGVGSENESRFSATGETECAQDYTGYCINWGLPKSLETLRNGN